MKNDTQRILEPEGTQNHFLIYSSQLKKKLRFQGRERLHLSSLSGQEQSQDLNIKPIRVPKHRPFSGKLGGHFFSPMEASVSSCEEWARWNGTHIKTFQLPNVMRPVLRCLPASLCDPEIQVTHTANALRQEQTVSRTLHSPFIHFYPISSSVVKAPMLSA